MFETLEKRMLLSADVAIQPPTVDGVLEVQVTTDLTEILIGLSLPAVQRPSEIDFGGTIEIANPRFPDGLVHVIAPGAGK